MDAFHTPEADKRPTRLDEINANVEREMAIYRRQFYAAIHLILIGLFVLSIWAVNEAERHYERQALINQERNVAWK